MEGLSLSMSLVVGVGVAGEVLTNSSAPWLGLALCAFPATFASGCEHWAAHVIE